MAFTYTNTFYVHAASRALDINADVEDVIEAMSTCVSFSQIGGIDCDTDEPCMGLVIGKVVTEGTDPSDPTDAILASAAEVYAAIVGGAGFSTLLSHGGSGVLSGAPD